MATRGSSLVYYITIVLAFVGARTIADDDFLEDATDSKSEIDNNYQQHLADMTDRLNSITLEEEYSTNFSDTPLIDIEFNDSTQLHLGKKNIHYNSLIYLQDYNQGISSDIKLPVMNSRFKTFTSSTNHANANETNNGLGIEDHNNRASGIIWEYEPVAPFIATDEELRFTTSYLSGESDVDNQGGDAVSFATSASAFKKTLQLRGEYAHSSFRNIKEKNQDNNKEAQHYLISYNPFIEEKNNNKGQWNIGLEKKTIDAQFQPIFNRNLPVNRDITRLFGHYTKELWSSEASLIHEKSNLNNQLNTTDNIHSAILIGRYKQGKPSSSKADSFFGQQEYSLQYTLSNKVQHFHLQEQERSQNETSESDPNSNHNRYQTFNIEGRYHYPKWQWFYKGGQTQANDKLDRNSRFNNHELEVGTQFSIGDNSAINTSIRSLTSRKTHFGLSSSEMNYGLSFHRTLTPNKTSAKLDFHYHHRNTELTFESKEEYQALTLAGDIQKRLLHAKGVYPNIDVNLSAHYKQQRNDYSGIDHKDYAALMNITLNWEPSPLLVSTTTK